MRLWEVPADRDYRMLRESRPPFITEYEKDLLAWQRRGRTMITALALFLTLLLGFALKLST